MPTSATHITIVERLAAEPAYTPVLGSPDPTLTPTDPLAIRMRYAAFGACGPDFLYALMDYGGDVQDLENVLMKTAGTFDALAKHLKDAQTIVNNALSGVTLQLSKSLSDASKMLNAAMTEG